MYCDNRCIDLFNQSLRRSSLFLLNYRIKFIVESYDSSITLRAFKFNGTYNGVICFKLINNSFNRSTFYKRYVSFDFDPKPPTPPPQGRSRREAPLRPSSSEPRWRDCRELQSRERQALRAAATSSASMMD